MYDQLKKIHRRPAVFSTYTADVLWTQPHLAREMLKTHLNQDTPLASRPLVAIDRFVNWLDGRFHLNGKAVCDLGCGPGLYTERYAQLGAVVCGLDFSANSIEYAKTSASENAVSVQYILADYITEPLPQNQDLITMIYCDLCPLSPVQRQTVLKKVRESIRLDGCFVFDVASIKRFESTSESTAFGRNYMNGFWSERDYFAFHSTYRYEEERVSLDHFTIVEENRSWDVYNWMQHYDPESICSELNANGFEVIDIVRGFDADGEDEATFGVVAKPIH